MVFPYFEYFLQKLNERLNYNEDDPLDLIRSSVLLYTKTRIFKFILGTTCAFSSCLFLTEIVFFSVNFDLQLFIRFFVWDFGIIHGYMAIWIHLICKGIHDNLNFLDTNFEKLNNIKYERILKMIKRRRYLFILMQFFIHTFYIFLLPVFGYEDEYYFPVYFFTEHVHPLLGVFGVTILRIMYYFSLYITVTNTSLIVNFYLYTATHMECEMILVEENLQNIDRESMSDELIEEHLIRSIKQYLRVKKSMDIMKEWIFWPMVATVSGSFMLLLSYVYFVIAQASLEAVPRIFTFFSASACTLAIYAICGQSLVNQCNNVNRSLYFLKWYDYSENNKFILRMFMMITDKPLILHLIGYLAVDATIIMKVYKFVFSSLATIQQVYAMRQK